LVGAVDRARYIISHITATTSILLLQSLAEFSNVAIRKARIPANTVKTTIEAWLAVLPLMPEDAKEAIGHGIRAKRSKAGAISFDLLDAEVGRAAL
jgi:predicted nucleic acid-binding protein